MYHLIITVKTKGIGNDIRKIELEVARDSITSCLNRKLSITDLFLSDRDQHGAVFYLHFIL